MDDLKSTSRRLTKKPPPSAAAKFEGRDNKSLRSERSSTSLHRAASARTYGHQSSSSSAQTHTHTRQITSPNPAIYSSSNSSLDRQISAPSSIIPGSEFNAPGPGRSASSSTQTSFNSHTSPNHDLIGAPFDGSSILSRMDSTKGSGYQNALRRPPPPPLSHTSPDPRLMSPPLRQSASFSAGDRMSEKSGPRVSENQLISPKRYSDETKDAKGSMMRKKSGFSGFLSNIGVGSPRGLKISAPENPVHVTHVGYDNQTGQFTVGWISSLDVRLLIEKGTSSGLATHD